MLRQGPNHAVHNRQEIIFFYLSTLCFRVKFDIAISGSCIFSLDLTIYFVKFITQFDSDIFDFCQPTLKVRGLKQDSLRHLVKYEI